MATEKQYAFFKYLYDEESARAKLLQEHAKIYLSLATLYSAFVLFVIEKLKPDSTLTRGVFIGTVIAMLTSFLLSLLATKVSTYEGVNHPREIIDGFGDSPVTDEEFFDDRLADFTIAWERDSQVNDKKAALISIAGYALLAGISLHACYFIIRLH
jgi:esterase/lipase superfamily enzyme